MNNTRTVKTMGTNGLESFTTVVLNSLHFESHLMSTNCGPLGLKADVEPSTNRAALSDRSWAHITHAADDDGDTADVDFDELKASPEVKAMIHKLRVCSCLIAYVLIFLKHIPHCQPNTAFASLLTNKFDSILWDEYNLPRPSKRKRIKRRMMFHLFAVEAAVAEKFFLEESAMAYDDMRPNADGTLSPYCVEQLVDVIFSLQRCLDHETILAAWSHSLDHSPPTCSHVFQMKTVLSTLHGNGNPLDFQTLDGRVAPAAGAAADGDEEAAPAAPASAPAPPPPVAGAWQGVPTADELEEEDDAAGNAAMDRFEQFAADEEAQRELENEERRQQQQQPAPAPAAPAPPPPAAGAGPSNLHGTGEDDPVVSPMSANGQPVCTTVLMKPMMQNGMTRKQCNALSDVLETQRRFRSEYCKRLEKNVSRVNGDSTSALATAVRVLEDGKDKNNRSMHKMPSTGRVVDCQRAATALLPSPQNALSNGYDAQFLRDVLEAKPGQQGTFEGDYQMLGIKPTGWHYECINPSVATVANRGPADYDFNWVMLDRFTKSKGGGGEDGGGGGGNDKKRKSVWTNATRVVKACTQTSSSAERFSLPDIMSMTFEAMRDSIFLIAQPLPENKIRISQHNHRQALTLKKHSRMLHATKRFNGESEQPSDVHPQQMFVPHTGGATQLTDEYKHAPKYERCDDGLGASAFQNRLDYLNDRLALPSCVMPIAFKKGVPIKECEANNGIYVNKWAMDRHSELVVEASAFLATLPGVTGGQFTKVPSSFREHPKLQADDGRGRDVRMEPDEERAAEAQPSAARYERMRDDAELDGGSGSAAGFDPNDPDPDTVAQDEMELDERDEEAQRLYEAEQEEEEMQQEEPPLQAEMEESDPSHAPLEDEVRDPSRAGTNGFEAGAGLSAAAAAIRASDQAQVRAMPYDWDMLQMFLTCKMIDTLHNDCQDYVAEMAKHFPRPYASEDQSETLRDLPQLCMRFPGLKDKDKNDRLLFPLTRSVPLKPSRVHDLGTTATTSAARPELAEAALSVAFGRRIRHDDPEVADHEADARGVDAAVMLEGNLFARSAWLNFTLRAMDVRGMRTDDEVHRARDQGLCMLLRVRNEHAISNGDVEPSGRLSNVEPMKCFTFTAQERLERERGELGASATDGRPKADAVAQSERARKRAFENATYRESMDAQAQKRPRI